MNGKGSRPRPYSVSADEYAARWALAFGSKQNNTDNTMDTQQLVNLLTRQQVAKYLQCSCSTVDRMAKAGHLKTVKLRRLVRFPEPDLAAILQAQTNPAQP